MDIPQPPQGQPGFFPQRREPVQPSSTIAEELNSINARLRMLEDRYTTLQRKSQVTEQNLIVSNRREDVELKALHSELMEIKKEFAEIKDRVKMFVNELRTTAKKEEVDVLKKYIALWEPVNFVTAHQAEQMINDAVAELRAELEEKEKALLQQ
ncbi:hypothetical protein J4475_02520 [Candidatus Woesearchaeota archaeon]|nr:hypothetical protein [Candidatus Woesearchaeota archaeon]